MGEKLVVENHVIHDKLLNRHLAGAVQHHGIDARAAVVQPDQGAGGEGDNKMILSQGRYNRIKLIVCANFIDLKVALDRGAIGLEEPTEYAIPVTVLTITCPVHHKQGAIGQRGHGRIIFVGCLPIIGVHHLGARHNFP